MSHYILIHGAAHGGWAWNKVKKNLEQKGHTAMAPDLPGHSMTEKIPSNEVTLERYVATVVEAVKSVDGSVILSGHSMGGAIITAAMEHIHEKVARIVYICALVPRNGDSIGKLLDLDFGSKLKKAFTLKQEEGHAVMIPEMLDELVYNGCKKKDIAFAKKHIVPQPVLPMVAPIALNQENLKNAERIGIVCTEDRSLSPGFQERMYAQAGCRIKHIAAGHMPLFSKAEAVSEILMA
jgi:pimeloyl-ACP methyl ester carboxylesterase